MYFDDFLTRFKKEEGPSLLLFFGDSDGVIAEGCQKIREKFKKSHPDGAVQVFEGAESSLGEVLNAAQTTGLFSTDQLLIVRNAQKQLGGNSDAALKQLKDYFSNPNPASRLVFLGPSMKKSVKAVAAVERLGWAVQCSDIPEWKMMGWLKTQSQEKGVGLDEEGAQILIQKTGTDIAYLQGALEQLALYIYPKKSATSDDVRNLPIPGLESDVFPFVDAVGLRQTEKALKLMNHLQDGVDTGTVMLLYGRFRELLMICVGRAKGWGQSQISEKLGLNPFRLKILWDQSSQFSVEELKQALLELIHIQAGVVTGRLGRELPAVLLEAWVLKRGKPRVAAKTAVTR
jgi:DNA polymerase III subunit delta